jgi:Fe(3+) dicitrate transport protein
MPTQTPTRRPAVHLRCVWRGQLAAALLFATLAGTPAPAFADASPFVLEGTVADTNGAIIPGAEVTLRRPEIGDERTVLTDERGRFRFEVPRARLLITVRSPGFAVDERALEVVASRAVTITLQPGGLTESISVVATQVVGSTESARWIPGSVDVIDADTLESSRPFTFGEVLRKAPGVHVKDEEGFGLRPSIGLRGLDPNRSAKVLLLEDGIPLGHAPYGDTDAYYHPPVERFASIEVVKGSAQIAFGPMTIGGVLNYVTPMPPDRPSGSVSLTGGSRNYLNAHANAGFRVGNVSLLVDGLRKEGDGARDHIYSQLHDANLKAVVEAGRGRLLTLKANYYRERSQVTYAGLTTAEFQANPRGNPFLNDRFIGDRTGLSASWVQAVSGNALFTAAVYGSTFNRDWWRQSSNSDQRPNDRNDPACGGMANLNTTCGNEGRLREYSAWGVDPRVRVASRWLGAHHETDLGVRAHWETQERIQKNGPLPTSRDGVVVEDNGRTNSAFSTYVQHRVLAGRWAVTPGLRVEHVNIERTNRLQSSGPVSGDTSVTVAIPGVGVSFSPASSTTVFGGIHRGFAPPRPADIISNTGGVLELESELSWNYEAGVRARVAPGVRGAATIFRLAYDNQIVPANLSGGVGSTLTSAGRTLHQGLETHGRIDFGTWRRSPHNVYVSTAYTFMRDAEYRGERYSAVSGFSRVSITGNRLPYAPRHTLSAGAGYAHPRGVDVHIEAVHIGEQFGDDLNTVAPTPNGQRGLLPAQTTWNANAAWHLGSAPRLTVFLAVKNLADATHIVDRRRGVFVGAPRLVHAGATVRF